MTAAGCVTGCEKTAGHTGACMKSNPRNEAS